MATITLTTTPAVINALKNALHATMDNAVATAARWGNDAAMAETVLSEYFAECDTPSREIVAAKADYIAAYVALGEVMGVRRDDGNASWDDRVGIALGTKA